MDEPYISTFPINRLCLNYMYGKSRQVHSMTRPRVLIIGLKMSKVMRSEHIEKSIYFCTN